MPNKAAVANDKRHGLLVALVVVLVAMLLIIFAALTVAPMLVIVLGLMTYVVWWHISREGKSFMHHAQVGRSTFGGERNLAAAPRGVVHECCRSSRHP